MAFTARVLPIYEHFLPSFAGTVDGVANTYHGIKIGKESIHIYTLLLYSRVCRRAASANLRNGVLRLMFSARILWSLKVKYDNENEEQLLPLS